MACKCRKKLYDKWEKKENTTRIVSLDYCAGSPIEPEVLKEYFSLARKYPGHTGSLHPAGLEAFAAFEKNWHNIQDHQWFTLLQTIAFPSATGFFYFLDQFSPIDFYIVHPQIIRALSIYSAAQAVPVS